MSVEAVHDRLIALAPAGVAVRPPGMAGGVVSAVVALALADSGEKLSAASRAATV